MMVKNLLEMLRKRPVLQASPCSLDVGWVFRGVVCSARRGHLTVNEYLADVNCSLCVCVCVGGWVVGWVVQIVSTDFELIQVVRRMRVARKKKRC